MEALRFEQLFARQWRNLAPLDLAPGARFNVISGDNGQGKSNLLEALCYLGSLQSFRGAPAEELVSRDADSAVIAAKVSGPPAPHTLKVRVHRGGKARELALDDKRPRSVATWLGVCPVVLFHPGDLELAQGGPDARRALLDAILSEMDPSYAATLATYGKALRSRNRLLREEMPDRRAITSFDPIVASAGAVLGRAREELVREIAPVTVRVAGEILGGEIPLEVRYVPRVPPSEEAILEALVRSLDKDLARGFTAEGPHADELALEVHARGAKHHASQGQQRTLVLALKVAELEVLAKRIGRVPPLLLDDVSSELDRTRNERFFALLAEMGGQVFLTTTHPELIRLAEGRVDWHVEAGRVTRAV
ncbi:DNA replication/repair protein RecF [Sandaracinus amylolyticus]|uniref:DNA replication and repair protein RecF n=1 Tax=Sandaracinus amylolyticus TaxID=927083 RepID=A0A0F6WAA5_9BACT|nr:DNA replication and repair protein RecF [Sandaracinus amylolyticus]AKF11423.1 DNA recombination and repair protein RecF [Sandaracinus amylolyticus]